VAKSEFIRVSVVSSAFSADPRVAARIAREVGFGGLQFEAFGGVDLTTLSQTGRREFLHVLSSHDQQLTSLAVDVGARGVGPGADLDRILAQLAKVLDAAGGLRCPVVCIEIGPLPEPPAPEKPRPMVTQEMAGLLILPPSITAAPPPVAPVAPVNPAWQSAVGVAMGAIAGVADRFGVTLAFRSELSSLSALVAAVRGPACPWFGIDLDPVAMLRDGLTPDGTFDLLGDLVRHARGRDASSGSDRRTKPQPIGRGDTKWDELLADLDAAGYHGFVTIDPTELTDRATAAAAGLKYLKLHGMG
jgi:sugar phosphate isomerase/epimerase